MTGVLVLTVNVGSSLFACPPSRAWSASWLLNCDVLPVQCTPAISCRAFWPRTGLPCLPWLRTALYTAVPKWSCLVSLMHGSRRRLNARCLWHPCTILPLSPGSGRPASYLAPRYLRSPLLIRRSTSVFRWPRLLTRCHGTWPKPTRSAGLAFMALLTRRCWNTGRCTASRCRRRHGSSRFSFGQAVQ